MTAKKKSDIERFLKHLWAASDIAAKYNLELNNEADVSSMVHGIASEVELDLQASLNRP